MILFLSLPLLVSASNTFGTKFLEDNQKVKGVVVLPSGLHYRVLHTGNGTDHPTPDSPCEIHYVSRIAENCPTGAMFDSSYIKKGPTIFAPNEVVKGWTEGMQLMVEGDKWEFVIPSDLGYAEGDSPSGVKPGAVLVIVVELVKIKGGKVPAKKTATASTEPSSSALKVIFDVGRLLGTPEVGSFTMQLHPEWAPRAAKRMQELVEANFFDDARFFRVIDGFMAQFGIHDDPSLMMDWSKKEFLDDAAMPEVGNVRGTVSFAHEGLNSRSTQMFINLGDNDFLDKIGFTPFAEVVDGMGVVDRIFKVGTGSVAPPAIARGDQKLENPSLSYVRSCRLAESANGESSGGGAEGDRHVEL